MNNKACLLQLFVSCYLSGFIQFPEKLNEWAHNLDELTTTLFQKFAYGGLLLLIKYMIIELSVCVRLLLSHLKYT